MFSLLRKTPRISIFYYEWENTAGNHCGMAYLAKHIKKSLDIPVKLYKCPKNYRRWQHRSRKLWRTIIIIWLRLTSKKDDVFFFMEYLSGMQAGDNREYALALRKHGFDNRMIGLVHLPLEYILNFKDLNRVVSNLALIDEIVVFGSSLARELSEIGYDGKIRQTFHYVDTNYYTPNKEMVSSHNFNIIVIGSLNRNYDEIFKIVSNCPEMKFHLLIGDNEKLQSIFKKLDNAITYKFLEELELLKVMRAAGVSLSVLHDTVGSNVITTSLACGLPQIVSDVGSIRDYLSEENAFFCHGVDEFVTSLKALKENDELRKTMSANARQRAGEITLEYSVQWFEQLFLSR